MDLEAFPGNDWIRAATLAHMVLCQAITDEQLDELVRPTPVQELRTPRAA